MEWSEWKVKFGEFLKETFNDHIAEYASGAWSIIVPIVENVAKIDLNNDGIKKHYKEEIIAIMKDEAIQFGNDLTEGVIREAEGGFLKKILASALVMKFIAQCTPWGPLPNWLLSLLIEKVVGLMKEGLVKLDEKVDKYAEEQEKLYNSEMVNLLTELSKLTPYCISTEHFWGSDTFKLFIVKNMEDKDVHVLTSSMAALIANKKYNFEEYMKILVDRINKVMS